MLDIFTLVPLYCLINSARYVCKSWATTIGCSYFVEAYEQHARLKPGLYVQNCIDKSRSYFLEFKDDVNGQFEMTPLGTPQKMGHVCCSCDGMLVLSNYKEYYAVNPILKCSFIIPQLQVQSLNNPHYVTIARVPHTTIFKLFCVAVIDMRLCGYFYVFYVLRIGVDNSWREIIRKKAPPMPYFFTNPLKGEGNALYWTLSDRVAVLDIDNEIIVREYPIPRSPLKNCPPQTYFLMGNRLSCCVRQTQSTYKLYILSFDSGEWSLYCDLGPYDFDAACGHELSIRCWGFSCFINDQIIIKVYLAGYIEYPNNFSVITNNIHFGYNLKTKQLTKIEGIDKGDYLVRPHTNSLVPLPSTPA
jgi:hypothetical protein